jgi:ribosomal protein L1
MKAAKRKRLERAGWRLVSTEEFLELSKEEQALVEIKFALADSERMKTSQSQVAKIETDDPGSSLTGTT